MNLRPLYLLSALLLFGCSQDPEKKPALGGELTDYEVITEIPGYIIYRPISVCADSPYVFIADEGLCTIAVLDWDLNWVRNIGRRGMGPGEFAWLKHATARDGILVALDIRNYRISLFTYEGEFLSSFRRRARGIRPEVALSPSGTIWVGQYAYSPKIDAYYTGNPGKPDTILTEYNHEGELQFAADWDPEVLTQVQASMSFRVDSDGPLMIFRHTPRITRLGPYYFDRFYEIGSGFPIIKESWEYAIKVRLDPNQSAGVGIAVFGGFDRCNDKIIISGPFYNLSVVELESGRLHPVSFGRYGVDLLYEGGAWTWDDIAIIGNRILLISSRTGKFVIVPLADVLAAAKDGVVLEPMPERLPGY